MVDYEYSKRYFERLNRAKLRLNKYTFTSHKYCCCDIFGKDEYKSATNEILKLHNETGHNRTIEELEYERLVWEKAAKACLDYKYDRPESKKEDPYDEKYERLKKLNERRENKLKNFLIK